MDEFLHGHFEVQDEASQLVSLRVDCKVTIKNSINNLKLIK